MTDTCVEDGAALNLYLSASGIGDSICALYAACGAANALREKQPEAVVRLHTGHPGWFERVRHPGVEILPIAEVSRRAPAQSAGGDTCGPDADTAWIDVSRGYDAHLAGAE